MYGSDIDLLDVRVRKVGTTTWTQIHTVNSTTASNQFTSSNSAWRKQVESLSNWAGDTIQIRFSAKRDVTFFLVDEFSCLYRRYLGGRNAFL
jgi:hypothetical protein